MKSANASKSVVIYWITISFLTLVNLNTALIGFHPYHDGLMLSTIRLLKESLLNGGAYPFNQYGSFWTMPYLGISLMIPDSHLLFSMRLATIVLYFAVGALTYKIAKILYGSVVAKVALIILILSRPLGLEPIPWPSSVGMFLTVSITFLLITAMNVKPSLRRNFLLFLAGALTVMSILTRVQIGGLTLIFVCLFLIYARSRDLLPFLFGAVMFSIFYGYWLSTLGWLKDSLWDQFVFGWLVVSSGEVEQTIPRTSLVMLFSLLLFFAFFRSSRRLTNVLNSRYWIFLTILCSVSVYVIYDPSSFQNYLGKFWVAFLFFGIFLFGSNLKELLGKKQNQTLLVGLMALANASQIFPLFDPMHAWWGLTPLVVLVSKWLVDSFSSLICTKLRILSILCLSLVLTFPYLLSASSQASYSMNSDDLALVYSNDQQSKAYNEKREFFRANIPQNASVLNLCGDSDVFFDSQLVITASRYFVYWPTMNASMKIQEEVLNSKPEYVLFCDSWGSGIPKRFKVNFTESPYVLLASLGTEGSLKLYTSVRN